MGAIRFLKQYSLNEVMVNITLIMYLVGEGMYQDRYFLFSSRKKSVSVPELTIYVVCISTLYL